MACYAVESALGTTGLPELTFSTLTRLSQTLRPALARYGLTVPLVIGILGLSPWLDAAHDRIPVRAASSGVNRKTESLDGDPEGKAEPLTSAGGSLPDAKSSLVPHTAGFGPELHGFFSQWSSHDTLRTTQHSASDTETSGISHTLSGAEPLCIVKETHSPHEVAKGFDTLPEVQFYSRNQQRTIQCRLYSSSGAVDESAARKLDDFLADWRDPKQPKVGQIDRRLLQLVFRTAYHFKAQRINVLSAYREQTKRREGLHALGRALDFSIPGVKPQALASYLRTLPRVGVGVYTHRRTRFVHLDVRDQSYHWLDASPPGRTWRGISLGNRSLPLRDRNYDPKDDFPEGLPFPVRSTDR